MISVRQHLRVAVAIAVALVSAIAAKSASASTAPPKWMLTVSSAPTNMVPTAASSRNEVEELRIEATSGDFFAEFQYAERDADVLELRYNISAAELQSKLEGLSTIGAGNVKVSRTTEGLGPNGEEPYLIEFVAARGNREIAPGIEFESEFGSKELKSTGSAKGRQLIHTSTAVKGSHDLEEFVITATNVGGTPTSSGEMISIASSLGPGAVAEEIVGRDAFRNFFVEGEILPGFSATVKDEEGDMPCNVSSLICTFSHPVAPGDSLTVTLDVKVTAAEGEEVTAEAVVSGGASDVESVTSKTAALVTNLNDPAPVGAGQFQAALSTPLSGSHPNVTTSIIFNEREEENRNGELLYRTTGDPKDIAVELPPGLLANPQAAPRCTLAQVEGESCPNSDAVGISTTAFLAITGEAGPETALVYNIEPYPGEPAAFAFIVAKIAVRLDVSVRSGGDYGATVTVSDINEGSMLRSTTVTLWGVPQEYNGTRQEKLLYEPFAGFSVEIPYVGPYPTEEGRGRKVTVFGAESTEAPAAFTINPTRCGALGEARLSTESWEDPAVKSTASSPLPSITGCEGLPFAPALALRTTTHDASQPAGYQAHIEVPQERLPTGPQAAEVRNVTVTLPAGATLSPSAANGLEACSDKQFGLNTAAAGECPEKSEVGEISINTPLLPAPGLKGIVYVGEPDCSPCSAKEAEEGKMVRLFIEAGSAAETEGSGVLIKLIGSTSINEDTGQLRTTFEENPQLPFSNLTLSIWGGMRAPLVNPDTCGPAIATAVFTPWSSPVDAEVEAPAIPIEGCSGSGRTFAPSLEAGMSTTAHGGSFSSFALTVSRADGQQDLGSVAVDMPPGIAARLAKVPLCAEAQANAGDCPVGSQIGTSTAVVGPGSDPYTVEGGQVYLTEKYGGGQFGLSIVTPAKAGPFTLAGNTGRGSEVVRAAIGVDPRTAAISVKTSALPTQLDGIPLDIDRVIVNVNRKGFMFNPTDCSTKTVAGTIDSSSGTTASVSYPFQATECASLAFRPTFSATTHARHSRKGGAYLSTKITSGSGQANLRRIHVTLPAALPSRLETLKQACTEAQFAANPAGCPEGAFVGTATVHTPVLPVPITGPAIFVSHGGRGFPNLDFVLQGDGVTIIQEGDTFINKKSVTTSTFPAVPDIPVESIEVNLPEGPHSALAANGNLCAKPLYMPSELVGQNGAVVEHKTKIKVKGCKPAIEVASHKVKGATATIAVRVPMAGKLVASGKGIARTVKHVGKAKTATLKVSLTAKDRRQLAKHPGHSQRVDVKLRFTPKNKNAKPISNHVTVLMK